jgi:hypothetical protein
LEAELLPQLNVILAGTVEDGMNEYKKLLRLSATPAGQIMLRTQLTKSLKRMIEAHNNNE